ncbi:MAG: cell division protein FtsZ [Chlorobiaceae bacterium]
MAFEIDSERFYNDQQSDINIKVVGVGRFGCRAVNYLMESKLVKVECIAVHTSPQALQESKAPIKVRIGNQFLKEKESKTSSGIGSRNRFSIGEEDRQNIATQLKGADLIILVAGMGKGSSRTLAPGVALVAQSMGILTVGLVTMPFPYEGKAKVMAAQEGIIELRKFVDTLIVIDSERISSGALSPDATVSDSFSIPYEVVYRAIKGLADVVTYEGDMKVNFADVAELMSGGGEAVFATASAFGEGSALKAVTEALKSLEAERESIKRTRGLLVNITGKVTMKDFSAAIAHIEQEVGSDTQIFNGYIEEPDGSGETRAMFIATGLKRKLPAYPPPRNPGTGKGSTPGKPVGQNPDGQDKKPNYRIPAFIRQKIRIKALEESPLSIASALSREDKIDKDRPAEPAFLRLIAE